MRALLDVNVLIALLDANHVHHARAAEWLGEHIGRGWASCPLTQIGCIRIMSQPAYPNAQPAALVASRLQSATDAHHHAFWAADVDALAKAQIAWDRILSTRHATDVYLLALAVAHGGCFVTFDQHVPTVAIAAAKARHLVVLD